MSKDVLPEFTLIDTTNFASRLSELLAQNTNKIAAILKNNMSFTWDNLMCPMDDMDDELDRLWSPLAHLHAVMNSPALRQCYEACLSQLSAYESAVGHNQALYDAIKSLDKNALDKTQRKIIDDTLRDFKLSGVALSGENKHRFEVIQARLSE